MVDASDILNDDDLYVTIAQFDEVHKHYQEILEMEKKIAKYKKGFDKVLKFAQTFFLDKQILALNLGVAPDDLSRSLIRAKTAGLRGDYIVGIARRRLKEADETVRTTAGEQIATTEEEKND